MSTVRTARDQQEQPDVEPDRADQLERADLDTTGSPGRGNMGERRVAERDPDEADAERDQQADGGDRRRVPQDRQAPLRALRPERDVAQRDRQRDDHAGAEAVADVGVALDDERRATITAGPSSRGATTSMTGLTTASRVAAGSRRR